MKKIFIFIQILAFIGFTGNIANGQIEITPMPEVTPEEMVEKIVGEGIQFSNVQYTGADHASGIFTNGSSTNLGNGKRNFPYHRSRIYNSRPESFTISRSG